MSEHSETNSTSIPPVETSMLTEKFVDFYREYYSDELKAFSDNSSDKEQSLLISFADLNEFDADLASDFKSKPAQMRDYAQHALYSYETHTDVAATPAHVRVTDLPESVPVSEIRMRDNNIGELISVQGVVRKATTVRPRVSDAAFNCHNCGTVAYIPQFGGDIQEPQECQGCGEQGEFQLDMSQSEMIDSQDIWVQEPPKGLSQNETPQSIKVTLENDLCGKVGAGSHVTVVGILTAENTSTRATQTPALDLYIDGVSVTETDGVNNTMVISEQDEDEIQQLSNQENIYEMMVGSLAPSLHGLEDEKLAILLQLFGGVEKRLENDELIRGQTHILLVGDPAVGLTRLIRTAAKLSPRATYSNAAETSKSGLTTTATRTGGEGNPWELTAGALPIADRGLAVIDNFSDASEDVVSTLAEPMERQQITISKASINESVDTRVGLLAASSPKYGAFDQYEPIADQLGIDSHVVTQFDLIFIISDDPSPDTDQDVADHIVGLNQAGELRDQNEGEDTQPISDPVIDPTLIRKYIAYARQITPVLTEDAKDEITDFYVELRSDSMDSDVPIPVTVRKLEAIVRLAEASARMRLSESVEVEDAKRATDIVESTLEDLGVTSPSEEFDPDVVGSGSAKRDRILNVKQYISNIEEEYEHKGGAPIDVVIDRAEGVIGMSESEVEDEIEYLRTKGELYEVKKGVLRTT